MSTQTELKPVTVPWVKAQKGVVQLTMLTAYDFPFATLLDQAGIDMLLVGDSLGTVLHGEPNTLSVTLEDVLRHTAAVTRAAKRAMVIADLPFLTYQESPTQAIRSAGRLLKEARAQAVKLEGGLEMAETVQALTRVGIPVVGHIGLTPQSIHALGSYRMHGKSDHEQTYLLDSAKALEAAGAFCIVLECVEASLSEKITDVLKIPTIGIGAGIKVDGQVLVTHDLLGLTVGRIPKFVNPVDNIAAKITEGVEKYIERTKNPGLQEAAPKPTQHKSSPLTVN